MAPLSVPYSMRQVLPSLLAKESEDKRDVDLKGRTPVLSVNTLSFDNFGISSPEPSRRIIAAVWRARFIGDDWIALDKRGD